MDLIKAIILGFIQGVTEFLPISSSGHLALADKLFPGGQADILFFTITHLGTMLATMVVFKKEIIAMIFSLKNLWIRIKNKNIDNNQRMLFYIFVGSVPTGVAGIMLADKFESMTDNMHFVASMLIITGLILFMTKYIPSGTKKENDFGALRAFGVGCAQGVAILPGISRSGTTISATLLLKGERNFAGRLSFLMSLPAILAANLLECLDIAEKKGSVHFSTASSPF